MEVGGEMDKYLACLADLGGHRAAATKGSPEGSRTLPGPEKHSKVTKD